MLTRRDWMKSTALFGLAAAGSPSVPRAIGSDEPETGSPERSGDESGPPSQQAIDIASRRELFVDDLLIDQLDGFVSVSGPYEGGQLTTKPLMFSGDRLNINYSTSAAGGLRVELQTAEGQPIDGFTLDDCPEIIGDRIEHVVNWKSGSDLGKLSGQPVRLRVELKDADLFSLQFAGS